MVTDAPPASPPGSDTASLETALAGLSGQLDSLFDSVPFGSHRVDAGGLYSSVNERELAWLGRRRDELVGRLSPLEFFTPQSRLRLAESCARNGAIGFNDLELELVGADQRLRPVAMSLIPTPGATPGEHPHRALLFDLSEPKRRQEQLRMAALSFESIAGICITDAEGHIVRVNRAFTEITGYDAAELQGQTMHMLSSGRRSRAFYETMWSQLKRQGRWQGEVHDRRKDGSTFSGWLSITAVAWQPGGAGHYVANLHDITAYKATQDEIRHLAFFDSLTQLPNRRLMEDRLTRLIAAAARSGRRGAILFIDLDHFKSLNDTRGHAAGDRLLVEVATRLRQLVRDGDTVARLGGDEFVVLLGGLAPGSQEAERHARLVADKLQAALAAPVSIGELRYSTSASIGVALFDGHETVSSLLQQSDLAMYEAKRAGRNTLRVFEGRMLKDASEEAAQAQALWRAFEDGEFELHYQPQFDAGRRVVAAEALLRWRHPQRGLVGPDDFMAVAESTGLIVRIGRWVLETACRQLAAWSAPGPCAGIGLSVNVSARQLAEPDFVDHLVRTVADAHIDPARLTLELTETTVHDVDDTRQKMDALRGLGLGFAMDDFGIGYSSLARLIHLPIRQLKIDRSFVRDMRRAPAAKVLVDTIMAMARSLQVEVVAEGVETAEQLATLQAAGCRVFQGSLVGQALPPAALEALLAAPRHAPPAPR